MRARDGMFSALGWFFWIFWTTRVGSSGARSRGYARSLWTNSRLAFGARSTCTIEIWSRRTGYAPETNEYTFLSVGQGMSWKTAPNGRDAHSAKVKSTVPGGMPDICAKGSTTPLCHSAMLA